MTTPTTPSGSRWIQVPKPIKLRDRVTRFETGEALPFYTWLMNTVLMDVRFAVNWQTNRMATNIADAFFEQEPGAWVRLNDSDYDLLRTAVENPIFFDTATRQQTAGYANIALFQVVGPFIASVQAARSEPPETEAAA